MTVAIVAFLAVIVPAGAGNAVVALMKMPGTRKWKRRPAAGARSDRSKYGALPNGGRRGSMIVMIIPAATRAAIGVLVVVIVRLTHPELLGQRGYTVGRSMVKALYRYHPPVLLATVAALPYASQAPRFVA